MRVKFTLIAWAMLACVVMQGCKHPLVITGEGDIVDVGNSGRGCTLEQFRAGDSACTENEVSGDYFVNYKAVPRPGWRFVRWEGLCAGDSDFQHCKIEVPREAVALWDETYPDTAATPGKAVFQPITGQTGFLLAGTPVAGVTYETATLEGVTGLDGSFHYNEGETVRFTLGDTVLGTVSGQARVTPFDLAGSPVPSGASVSLHRQGFGLWWGFFGQIYPAQAYTLRESIGIPGEHFFQRPDPFETVTNITVLLQSLDEDAAPGNGIVIRAAVANMFSGVSLELRQRENPVPGTPQMNPVPGNVTHAATPGDFPTLRYKLAQANHNQLFSVAHGAVRPAVALQRLYQALGIPDKTYAICSSGGWDFDPVDCRFDADGNLTWQKQESGSVARYEYDARGNMTQQQTGQSTETWQYNTLGDPVQTARDGDGDGAPEAIDTWQYDRFGNVTRYEEDHDADGTVDILVTSEYDELGKPLRLEEYAGDPREVSTASWQYHTNGRLMRYEEATRVWQYDTSGRLSEYRDDDVIETREYDDEGNFWAKEYKEYPGDDSPTSLIRAGHYQFDAAGRLERYTRDNNLDGRREQLQTWRYDADGRVERYIRDDDYNTVQDYIETWSYAADGRTMQAEGVDATGTVVDSRTWEYDANGRLTRYTQDGRADYEDSFDEPATSIVETWQYNPGGELTRHTISRGEDQSLYDMWFYDEDGNLIRFERNHDGFGAPGPVESWQFHTTGWGHLFGLTGL